MSKAKGQSLVEFALVIPLFLALMVGILDGTRLLFTYNSLQEAAHAGARWGSVNVGRLPWGASNTLGNGTGTWRADTNTNWGTGPFTPTIVGQAASKLIAIDHHLATVDIVADNISVQQQDTSNDPVIRISPVTVTVSYTFVPVLGFGHVHIPLVGRVTTYHE